MSTVIVKATCPDCGDVRLKVSDVTLRVCVDNQQGSFRFKCPRCKNITVKDTSDETMTLLESNGVRREEWKLPLELWEPHPEGPTITLDDVLAFHEELESGEWKL